MRTPTPATIFVDSSASVSRENTRRSQAQPMSGANSTTTNSSVSHLFQPRATCSWW
ncbi:hypothetical protein ACFQE7_44955 [Nonomuraea ferruginea]|uniref:hypothetical protein n=1 Tax=Nonomuraea ferruginea TaxID=46174 RepID=UPI0036240DAE